MADISYAAVVTWDNDSGDGKWSTASNWSGNAKPTSADIATFNSTSVVNVTADETTTVDGIDIQSTYSGTITVNSGITITVGNSSTDVFNIASGTFDATNATLIDLNGDFTLSNGTFKAPNAVNATTSSMNVLDDFTVSGGTFTKNSSTIKFDGTFDTSFNVVSSLTLHNIILNKDPATDSTLSLADGDTLSVAGTFTINEGRVTRPAATSSTLDLQGDLSITDADATFANIIANVLLQFTGGNTQTITLSSAASSHINSDVTVNKTAGTTLTVASGSTLTLDDPSQTFTLSQGTFNLNGNNMSLVSDFTQTNGTFTSGSGAVDFDGSMILSDGTFTATSGTMKVRDDWNHTAGTFTHNSGTVEFDADAITSLTVPASNADFNHVTINKNTTVQVTVSDGNTVVIRGNLTITDGRFSRLGTTANAQVYGNVTIGAATDTPNFIPLTLIGTATQTLSVSATYEPDFTINKTGGSVQLGTNVTLNSDNQDLVVQEGTIDLNGFNLIVNGQGSPVGKFIVENGGNLQLRGTETVTTNSGYPDLQGGSTVTYTATSGTVTLKDYTYQNLTINGVGGTFQLGVNESLVGVFTLTAGTFNLNNNTFAINGNTVINGGTLQTGTNTITFGGAAGDTVTISSGTLEIQSDNTTVDIVKNANTWTNSGGTISYAATTGVSTTVLASLSPYNNLTINSSGSTYSLNGTLDVNGNFTITTGTFDVSTSNYGMTVAGNWGHSGGTFTPRSGTVTFDDSSKINTISGSTTFTNLTSVTAGKTLTFTAGTTQTVTGTLTLTGASGNLIVLNSTINDSAWNLTVSGSSAVSYVNVRDSNASGGNAIDAGSTSTNSGNNTNWIFNTAPSVASVTATPRTNGTGTVAISFALSDVDGNVSQALVEYNLGSGWLKATLSTTAADISATTGTPTVTNANTYPIGSIVTSNGANTVSVVWLSKTDVASADLTTAQIRVTPYDGTIAGTAVVGSQFTLDNVAPSGLANFRSTATTSSTITWSWTAATTETRFDHYEIWYGTIQSDVDNRTGTASEWDNSPNDAALATLSTAITTITNLLENTTYYAKIFAVDTYGNEATVSTATANNNGKPTLSNFTASQSSVGDGVVTVSFQVNDVDGDNTLQALLEHNIGNGWIKVTALSEVTGDATATYGTPNVENDNTYQIGNTNSYIQTSSGANTVTVKWRTLNESGGSLFNTSAAQMRVTPYDGIENGATLSTSNVLLDNVAPVGLANFINTARTATTATFTWTAVTTEISFHHYEIWYGTVEADVTNRTGTASKWDQTKDTALSTQSTGATIITGLQEGTLYYFKNFAVDTTGYTSTTTGLSVKTNQKPVATNVAATTSSNGTGRMTVSLIVSDGDSDGVELLVEYTLGNNAWNKATISTSDISVSAGSVPTINNSNPRQIGAANGRVSTGSGANTVTVVWLSMTDAPTADVSIAQVRITPYDALDYGSAVATSLFTLDNVKPQGPTNVTLAIQGNAVLASWTPITAETNFDHYELWYSGDQNAVTGRLASAIKFDATNDVTLRTMSTGSVLITTLTATNGIYSVGLWGVDRFGNETGPILSTINLDRVSTPTGGGGSSSGGSNGESNDDTDHDDENTTVQITEETSSNKNTEGIAVTGEEQKEDETASIAQAVTGEQQAEEEDTREVSVVEELVQEESVQQTQIQSIVPSTASSVAVAETLKEEVIPDWWLEAFNVSLVDFDAAEDSDGDGMTNGQEYQHGTDPFYAEAGSLASDQLGEEIILSEELHAANDITDSDGDGLSDLFEYAVNTDPYMNDTDGDGINDNEELLIYGTNPIVPDAQTSLVAISNWRNSDVTADNQPFVLGIAPAGSLIELIFAQEDLAAVVGTTTTNASGVFSLVSDQTILDGTYYVFIRAYEKSSGGLLGTSRPFKITIDITTGAETIIKLLKLNSEVIDGSVIVINNQRPVLEIESALGAKVHVYWESFLLASAMLAQINVIQTQPPSDLAAGVHTVYIQAEESGQKKGTILSVEFIVSPLPVFYGTDESGLASTVVMIVGILGICCVLLVRLWQVCKEKQDK